MIDIEKLKQAREAATPGPWRYSKCYSVSAIESDDGDIGYLSLGQHKENATLIAMAPDLADAVIELAEALVETRKDFETWAAIRGGAGVYKVATDRIDAALAKHIKGETE